MGWQLRWIEQVRQRGWRQDVILVGGAFSCGRVAASTWGVGVPLSSWKAISTSCSSEGSSLARTSMLHNGLCRSVINLGDGSCRFLYICSVSCFSSWKFVGGRHLYSGGLTMLCWVVLCRRAQVTRTNPPQI